MELINACGNDTPPFEGMSAILLIKNSKGIDICESSLDLSTRNIRIENGQLIINCIFDINHEDFASKFVVNIKDCNTFILIRLEDYHRNYMEFLCEVAYSYSNYRFPNIVEMIFEINRLSTQRVIR